MKQHITIEQYLEISGKAQNKLDKWLEKKKYTIALSIGQMIEFLEEHTKQFEHFSIRLGRRQPMTVLNGSNYPM